MRASARRRHRRRCSSATSRRPPPGWARDGAAYRRLVGPLVAGVAGDRAGAARAAAARAAARCSARAQPRAGRCRARRGRRCSTRGASRESAFAGERARALFAGHAAHSMLPLEQRPSARRSGSRCCTLAHAVGWPSPRGGVAADRGRARRASSRPLGGRSRPDVARRASSRTRIVVLADVLPRDLLRIGGDRLPGALPARPRSGYRAGPGAFKLDWALDGPIPWRAAECARAGTVHVGGTFDEIAASERAVWPAAASRAAVPPRSASRASSTRPARPTGKHTAWAYCHVPNGWPDDLTERVEAQVERFAPGFRDLILARRAIGPGRPRAREPQPRGRRRERGARPTSASCSSARPGGSSRTGRRCRGLYLCSAATPPGGGVHGMCGYGAARLALRDSAARPPGSAPAPRR